MLLKWNYFTAVQWDGQCIVIHAKVGSVQQKLKHDQRQKNNNNNNNNIFVFLSWRYSVYDHRHKNKKDNNNNIFASSEDTWCMIRDITLISLPSAAWPSLNMYLLITNNKLLWGLETYLLSPCCYKHGLETKITLYDCHDNTIMPKNNKITLPK